VVEIFLFDDLYSSVTDGRDLRIVGSENVGEALK